MLGRLKWALRILMKYVFNNKKKSIHIYLLYYLITLSGED